METEVGPSIISIFEFLLSDHYAQSNRLYKISSAAQHPYTMVIILSRLSRHHIVQSRQFKHAHHHYLGLNPLTQDSDPTGNALLLEVPSDTAPA